VRLRKKVKRGLHRQTKRRRRVLSADLRPAAT
jgi:hypothetical protein